MAVVTPPIPPQELSDHGGHLLEPRTLVCRTGGGDKFSKLSAPLRAKLRTIADAVTLATVRDYLRYQQTPRSSADDLLDDAPEEGASLDIISASDQRNRELRNRIISNEEDEESIQQWQIAVCISKRVALAELIGNYIKERDARRAVPKKKPRNNQGQGQAAAGSQVKV
jgi:hypothetical protein